MVSLSKTISKLKVKLCIHVQGIATSLVVLFIAVLLQIFCRMLCFLLLWLYMAISQVSVYRTIGPLVFRL